MKEKKTFVNVTDEEGILLDRFELIDLAGGQKYDDKAKEDAQEAVGRPMCNSSLVERLQKTAFRNFNKKVG